MITTIIDENLKKIIEQTGYKDLRLLYFLYYLVKYIEPNYILELGTGYGCSTIFMALAYNKTKIISVDNYQLGFISNDISKPTKNIRQCNVGDRVSLIINDTRYFMSDIHYEIIFMDASHNKEDLWLEYKAFKNCIDHINHIIVMDDIYSANAYEFFIELSKKYELSYILPFHEGMGILSTNIDKYMYSINKTIWETNNV